MTYKIETTATLKTEVTQFNFETKTREVCAGVGEEVTVTIEFFGHFADVRVVGCQHASGAVKVEDFEFSQEDAILINEELAKLGEPPLPTLDNECLGESKFAKKANAESRENNTHRTPEIFDNPEGVAEGYDDNWADRMMTEDRKREARKRFRSSAPEANPETLKPETSTEPASENQEVLDWFETKKKSRYSRNDTRVSSVPENAVKLDNTKHRYCLAAGSIYKYAALKSGGYAKQHFGNAAFAPEFVTEVLKNA